MGKALLERRAWLAQRKSGQFCRLGEGTCWDSTRMGLPEHIGPLGATKSQRSRRDVLMLQPFCAAGPEGNISTELV